MMPIRPDPDLQQRPRHTGSRTSIIRKEDSGFGSHLGQLDLMESSYLYLKGGGELVGRPREESRAGNFRAGSHGDCLPTGQGLPEVTY